MVRALAQVLGNLTRFDAAQGHVDNNAIGMEALSANAGLEARRRRFDPEIIALAEMVPEHDLKRSVRPDNEDFIVNLGLEIAQGHSMLLEEPQEVLPRDA